MADSAGPDNVPNEAINQADAQRFMAIQGDRSRVVFIWMRIRHGHDRRRANQREDKDLGKSIAVR
jgi:hypothetical protein